MTPEEERARMIARMRCDGKEEEDLTPAEARKRMIARMHLDEWEESKHPRAKDGKFTSGSGASKNGETESGENAAKRAAKKERDAETPRSLTKREKRKIVNRVVRETSVKVDGSAMTHDFVTKYKKEHPELKPVAEKCMKVLDKVKNFQRRNPGISNGTYSAITGKPVNFTTGYAVTFHQNHSLEDPYADYTDEDYAYMCAIAMNELGSEDVYIGYFGNAEVSFHCNDLEQSVRFAVQHNQDSIYDCKSDCIWKNKKRNKATNPVADDYEQGEAIK